MCRGRRRSRRRRTWTHASTSVYTCIYYRCTAHLCRCRRRSRRRRRWTDASTSRYTYILQVYTVGRRSRPPSRSQQVFRQTKQKATCPKLAEVARHLLAGPAASTLSERSFSIAGRTIEDRRTQLSVEFVDGLMFLHGLAE